MVILPVHYIDLFHYYNRGHSCFFLCALQVDDIIKVHAVQDEGALTSRTSGCYLQAVGLRSQGSEKITIFQKEKTFKQLIESK